MKLRTMYKMLYIDLPEDERFLSELTGKPVNLHDRRVELKRKIRETIRKEPQGDTLKSLQTGAHHYCRTSDESYHEFWLVPADWSDEDLEETANELEWYGGVGQYFSRAYSSRLPDGKGLINVSPSMDI